MNSLVKQLKVVSPTGLSNCRNGQLSHPYCAKEIQTDSTESKKDQHLAQGKIHILTLVGLFQATHNGLEAEDQFFTHLQLAA